jgi:hypothetical protein
MNCRYIVQYGYMSPTAPTLPQYTVFPPLRASNLNGRELNLPSDFEGKRNLVILAFKREQQELVDSWLPTLDALLGRYPDLRFYELPTIYRGNPFFRAWLDSAMRFGIPDKQARERTITLYLDKPDFRAALGLPHEDTVYLLLLDGAGQVLWRGKGAYSPHMANALDEILASGA